MARQITVGVARPAPSFAPMFVAIDKGFFADEGLEATLAYGGATEPTGGLERMFSGEIDYASGAIGRGGVFQETGLILVCGHATRVQPHILMARPEFEDPSMLKQVIMTNLVGGGIDRELKTILAHHGVDLDQSGIVLIKASGGHPEQYKLLKEGIGDAAPVGPPWWMFLSREGYRNMGSESDYTPGLSCTGIHVTPAKIAKDHEEVQAFVRAYVRANRYCQENIAGTVDAMLKYSSDWGVTDAEIAKEVYDVASPYWSAQIAMEPIKRLLQLTAEKTGKVIELESFVNLYFLNEANAALETT